ncbi:hypothetical protein DOTSEDRAFT_135330 [Dothistroma septosporum NZE10]|uniref:Heme haloperoxidase family profile domain-containing protein n=1 Tax=Dothistroma septosporum (strain NZE10 / CBS 128990) TaxID=675120 RepID=N1PK21_DOTSN|nr:hypothetical protein DOTSEDRAFT_135330 [Dothistroma septosporum NZE10]
MKSATLLLGASPLAAAFPGLMGMGGPVGASNALNKRTVYPSDRDPAFKSGKPNTAFPPPPFDYNDQYVSTTGDHAWAAPGPSDQRGQCPGLNAAANHGYLNRNGISSIPNAIQGLGAAYNMAPDLAGFLAILGVGLAGDPLSDTWSIGGMYTPSVPLFPARGIIGTHNKYEGDASIMRGDAYLHGGSPGVLEMHKFINLYNMGETFGFDEAAKQADYSRQYSLANNPYYFSAPFSGLVAPAAHNLVINLMSNHSAEVPGGTLTRATLMSFFSITGDSPDNFVHNRGMERIPDNWYRRPTALAHTIPDVLADLAVMNAQYPGTVSFGGNTGTVNSFAGVDTGNITNGAINSAQLFQGNNGACFLLQASLSGLPNAAEPALGAVGSILGWAQSKLGPTASDLGCPELSVFDNQIFNPYPGYAFPGTGTDQ